MVNKSTNTVSFDTATSAVTKTLVTGLILFFGLQPAARADINAYMITGNEDFGTIDLNTGVYTSIGSTVAVSGTRQLSGIGEIGSTLYGECLGCGQGILYSINPTNGNLTQIGLDNNHSFTDFGSTLTGLYGVDISKNLYSIDATTGIATLLGSTGVAAGSAYSLSTNSSTLFFASAANLYTLNLTTGASTLVGATGGPQFGGLVLEGSVLYGGEFLPTKEVDTLNTGTGAATAGPGLTGTTNDFFGLAAIPATSTVPEPRSVSWLLLGLLAGGAWVQTRLRNSKRQPE